MGRLTRLGAACALVASALVTTAPGARADSVRDAQWYLRPLGVEQAWQTTRGAGVTVCVIDSGIDTRAADIGAGTVARTRAFTEVTAASGTISPHGTGVAAFLAGRGHGDGDTDGVVGTAPRARLLSAVVNEYDRAHAGAQIDRALHWCIDNGARVVNLTETEPTDGGMSEGIRYAQAKDAVVVAAAGNTFEKVTDGTLPYPAVLPGVVAVAGINRTLAHDGGSTLSTRGKAVSISAPMTTTDSTSGYPAVGLPAAQDRSGIDRGEPYDLHAAGTSYAAPIVAGVAALIRAAHPGLNANGVIDALLRTASHPGRTVPDRTYGYGVLDAAAAVSAAPRSLTANPLVQPPASASPSAPASSAPTSPAPASSAPASAAAPARAAPSSGSHTAAWITGAAVAVLVVGAAGTAAAIRRRRGVT